MDTLMSSLSFSGMTFKKFGNQVGINIGTIHLPPS
jgi:hypothetical protein